jgi:hypothetical protein
VVAIRGASAAGRGGGHGGRHGLRRPPCPIAATSRGGRKAEAREEVVADGWGPHGSETRRCVVIGLAG